MEVSPRKRALSLDGFLYQSSRGETPVAKFPRHWSATIRWSDGCQHTVRFSYHASGNNRDGFVAEDEPWFIKVQGPASNQNHDEWQASSRSLPPCPKGCWGGGGERVPPGVVGEFFSAPLRVGFSKCGPGDLRVSYDFVPSMGPNSAKLGPWFYVCSMHRIGDQLSSRVCPDAIGLAFWFGSDSLTAVSPMKAMRFRCVSWDFDGES